ncbi:MULTISPECIES: SDR family NAD(P)-dependent oxidoreductase [Bacillaceae]|uniref:SDR family NAD(P)-dependent oxidoreductase n=1 Tax=Evansella alkalicola TaxID=745819 RepID=A0ABS6JS15_9BACI|nr:MULTISPECIES: SDR family NAD(P)-dependent oxidoreductase [Bacillaceae]MBU9721358.1 SDR family NAD(P)-dependent oxidoreductase [Bacillus alkalicola]
MKKYRLLESCLFLPTYLNKRKLNRQLEGKSILITGASSGIGKELTYELADISCNLIVVARRRDMLAQIKKELKGKKANVYIFQADLRNEGERETFLTFLHELPNGANSIDIVVSNAGLSIRRSIFHSLDRYHDFTRTMAINYFAPVHILLSLLPHLKKNCGQIINISTVNALLAPVPDFAAYQASKSALDMWLRSASTELKEAGINVTSIYLPLVRTPMIEPTTAYGKMPAMSPKHVARIICKSMYTKKKRYKPWWLIFGQVVSIFTNSFSSVFTKGGKSE